jgi:hypothetical protein
MNNDNKIIYENVFYGLDSTFEYIVNCDELVDIEKILDKSILSINSFLDERDKLIAERRNDN